MLRDDVGAVDAGLLRQLPHRSRTRVLARVNAALRDTEDFAVLVERAEQRSASVGRLRHQRPRCQGIHHNLHRNESE